jgi:hypothetical protein
MRRKSLLAALAVHAGLAGCYRDTPATTAPPPANKQAAPAYAHEADDELAFLPKESEIVVGVDLATLRNTPAWRDQMEPGFDRAAFEKIRKLCGFNPWALITRITLATRKLGSDSELVVTLAGGDAKQAIACGLKQATTEYTARADGDVTILSKTGDNFTIGLAPVGRSHALAFATPGVDAKRVHAQLAVGSPLRSSPAFMALYDKLERGASAWFIINGSSPLFTSMSFGVRPKYIDGTLIVTDRYTLATRVTMFSAADASSLATTLQGVSGQLKALVETFDIRVEGEALHIDLVLTQPQMQTLLAMVGIFGP